MGTRNRTVWAAGGGAEERMRISLIETMSVATARSVPPRTTAGIRGIFKNRPLGRWAIVELTGAAGLSCSACHGKANLPASYGTHTPPGVATEWRLPPADHKLVFWGLDSKSLCEQIKDPKRNGGKNLADLTHHMTQDALTLWGWQPGYGRSPVQISHDEFVRAYKTWADAGMPCAQKTAMNP